MLQESPHEASLADRTGAVIRSSDGVRVYSIVQAPSSSRSWTRVSLPALARST